MTGQKDSADRVKVLLAEQAAEWVVRLEDPGVDAAERAQFATWLKCSPAHVLEFLQARAVWEGMSGTALQQWPEMEALLKNAATADSVNVVQLQKASLNPTSPMHQAPPTRLPGHRKFTRIWAAAAALILVTVASVSGLLRNRDASQAQLATAAGEQATHVLTDGSTVVLNTRSRLRLKFSPHARDVYLDEGEALFEVAHDASRPFRVWAGDSMVRAIGTRFNVYRSEGKVTVTVLEGRVEATSGASAGDDATLPDSATAQGSPASAGAEAATTSHVQLIAGDRASIASEQPIRTERLANPERSIDWRARRLVFDQTPLAEVIAEFNRYSETPLRLQSEALANKRINGVFDASDRASLVRFLEELEGVEVESRDSQVLLKAGRTD